MMTTHDGPNLAQDAFFLPITTIAAERAQASQGSLRQAIESQIERLIAFLDMVDGFTLSELEADEGEPDDAAIACAVAKDMGNGEDDEPSLAGLSAHDMLRFMCSSFIDVEQEEGNDEDGGDDEPSLGFSEPVLTGEEHDWWFPYMSTDAAQHPTAPTPLATIDAEGEHDGSEDGHDAEDETVDDEPSLGWTTSGVTGAANDLELDLVPA